MTFFYYDLLLCGVVLCLSFGVYAASRWIEHEDRLLAIQREMDTPPFVDPWSGYPPRVSMGSLPAQQLAERDQARHERHRLMLVVSNSSERVH